MNRILVRLGTTVLMLCAMSFAPAHAFVDPPTFEPTAPTSAQPITASVRYGVCHVFLAAGPGIPPPSVVVSNGRVDIYHPGVIIVADPFCNNPISSIAFDLGTLPADTYQVRVWLLDEDSGFQAFQVSSAALAVSQAPTQPIPVFGPVAAVVLALSILLVAAVARRRSRMWLLIGLFASSVASAQSAPKTLMVLLSAAPNAPTPDELVEPLEFSAGYLGALSPGFRVENRALPIPSFGTAAAAALVAGLIGGSPARFARSIV